MKKAPVPSPERIVERRRRNEADACYRRIFLLAAHPGEGCFTNREPPLRLGGAPGLCRLDDERRARRGARPRPRLRRPGIYLREPGHGGRGDPRRQDPAGRRGPHSLRGAARRTGHAGDALSDELSEIEGAGAGLRARHRRPIFGRHLGPVDWPCLAGSRRRRRDRPVEEGDRIEIDIPNRTIHVALDDAELKRRHAAMAAKGDAAWRPAARDRHVSAALQAYAALTTSAARGAVRDLGRG
jgi:hypothetical protein